VTSTCRHLPICLPMWMTPVPIHHIESISRCSLPASMTYLPDRSSHHYHLRNRRHRLYNTTQHNSLEVESCLKTFIRFRDIQLQIACPVQIVIAHARYHVTCTPYVKFGYIFEFLAPTLPIHYDTFIGLR